jgi:hypothetical protein
MMRRTVSAGIALFAGSLMLGCTPMTSPLDLSGVYVLKSVNGVPLPFVLPGTGATTVVVLSDEFTLNPGGPTPNKATKA